MKKKIVIFLSILLLTGCSFYKIEESTVNEILDEVLSIDTKLYNNVFDGYKYYVPRGLKVIEKNNYNTRVIQGKETFYIYVDVVSYYYNVTKDFVPNSGSYFSKELKYNGKRGYINITKVKEHYFVEFMYNYAKIEAMISEQNLKQSILNMSYILSSVKYNHSVINTLIGENILNYKEEKFDIFTSKKENNNFLEYYEKHENEDYKEDEDDVLNFETLE